MHSSEFECKRVRELVASHNTLWSCIKTSCKSSSLTVERLVIVRLTSSEKNKIEWRLCASQALLQNLSNEEVDIVEQIAARDNGRESERSDPLRSEWSPRLVPLKWFLGRSFDDISSYLNFKERGNAVPGLPGCFLFFWLLNSVQKEGRSCPRAAWWSEFLHINLLYKRKKKALSQICLEAWFLLDHTLISRNKNTHIPFSGHSWPLYLTKALSVECELSLCALSKKLHSFLCH